MMCGKISSVYQTEIAGIPNIPIPIIRYRRSNAAKIDKRLQNDFVSLMLTRFFIRNTMLKIFTTEPTIDT